MKKIKKKLTIGCSGLVFLLEDYRIDSATTNMKSTVKHVLLSSDACMMKNKRKS